MKRFTIILALGFLILVSGVVAEAANTGRTTFYVNVSKVDGIPFWGNPSITISKPTLPQTVDAVLLAQYLGGNARTSKVTVTLNDVVVFGPATINGHQELPFQWTIPAYGSHDLVVTSQHGKDVKVTHHIVNVTN